MDIRIPPGAVSDHEIAPDHNAFAYVFEGEAAVGADDENPETNIREGELAVLADGDAVRIRSGASGARLILVAGRPLNEPVFKYGPFVMNSKEEIIQAIQDYQNGTFSAPAE
jgi:hypothetical protein